jgi:endoglucanase
MTGERPPAARCSRSRLAYTVRALVQQPVKPWTPNVSYDETVGTEQKTYTLTFTPADSRKDAQVAVQIGGARSQWFLCLDDVRIEAN